MSEDGVGVEAEYYEQVQEFAENGQMVDVENEADFLLSEDGVGGGSRFLMSD